MEQSHSFADRLIKGAKAPMPLIGQRQSTGCSRPYLTVSNPFG
jgi:hypothetical protein